MAKEFIAITNLSQFNQELKVLANLPAEQALLFQKKIALELFTRIVVKTPVGNPSIWKPESLPPPKGYVGGRARGNWQIGVISPDSSGSVVPDPSGIATIQIGTAKMQAAQPFETIWIFNNVRYIRALEDGHSTQAPVGMVALSVAEVQSGLVV